MPRIGTRAYLKTLIKDPLVSSVTPTSIFGIKRLCDNINFREVKLIVEYGPGGGVITKYLLANMGPNAKLIAIENNKEFCTALKSSLKDDRLILVHDSAENVQEILEDFYLQKKIPSNKADHIISGIPFSMFPLQLKNKILNATKHSIKSNGSFIVYQFLISLSYGKKDIKRKIREYFNVFRSVVELRNVPPLRIYECSIKTQNKMTVYPTAKTSSPINLENTLNINDSQSVMNQKNS